MEKRETMRLAEIAKLAGVSESTASRALAGSSLVAEKTRARVIEVARLANYSVNQNARNLRLKQTKIVEVVAPVWQEAARTVSDPFILEMIGVVADKLNKSGYELLLSTRPPWADNWSHNSLVNGRADAIILIGQGTQHQKINKLAESYRNVIVWGADIPHRNYCVVGSNNPEGGRLATEHLVSIGRKKIAYFGEISHPEGIHRFEGYKKALLDADIEFDPALVFEAGWDFDTARRSLQPMLSSGIIFDAAFVSGDNLAMNLISYLASKGISVPGDVSVVGFDNVMTAKLYNPALTRIDQDIHLGGELLAERALQSIAGDELQSIIIPPKLIVRETCGGSL